METVPAVWVRAPGVPIASAVVADTLAANAMPPVPPFSKTLWPLIAPATERMPAGSEPEMAGDAAISDRLPLTPIEPLLVTDRLRPASRMMLPAASLPTGLSTVRSRVVRI